MDVSKTLSSAKLTKTAPRPTMRLIFPSVRALPVAAAAFSAAAATAPSLRTAPLAAAAFAFERASPRRPPALLASSASSASASFADRTRLPTKEQLSSDPFIDQVAHGSALADLLSSSGEEDDDDEEIATDLLSAQLSHPNGIRGFFVAYLTGEGEGAADREEVPGPLRRAMSAADPSDLVPLACMNVIMPTAMVSMHTDPEMSASSAKTAERGKRVLGALGEETADVKKNCGDIVAAAKGMLEKEGSEKVGDGEGDYWTEFCEKWGYGENQLKDIVSAVENFC